MSISLYNTLISYMASPIVMLLIETFSIMVKFSLIIIFIKKFLKSSHKKTSFLLLCIITFSIFENISWLIKLSYELYGFPNESIKFMFIIIAWASFIIMYHSLLLFIQSFKGDNTLFIKRKFSLSLLLFCISSLFLMSFVGCFCINFFENATINPKYILKLLVHYNILGAAAFYSILILLPYAIYEGISILKIKNFPKLLAQQVKACIKFFLIPHFIANVWQTYPFNQLTMNSEALAFSELFLILTIFYFFKTIIGLRFLNIHTHIDNKKEFNFLNDFKKILDDLGHITNHNEIKLLAQQFFHKAFHIDPQQFNFGIIASYQHYELEIQPKTLTPIQAKIEHFIGQDSFIYCAQQLNLKIPIQILIYDEIAYNHFHNPTSLTQELLHFLDDIHADIFLPLYGHDRIIGYIFISKSTSDRPLYSKVECDEMIVFSTYAAKIVDLLQNRNLHELLKERKEILEELYKKHQEINKYKESIQSFLKINKGNSIGIIVYKNKVFSLANEDAHKILGGINPNIEKRDQVSKTLHTMATKIENYKAPQLQILHNIHNERFVISGIPHPDNNSIIFTLYYPELSDIIEELIDHIKDPSDWDYLLYLESTESGKLINTLIPGNGKTLLNFKIELLKVALTKKALLLHVPDADSTSLVELIHHISLKEDLHTLNLHAPCTTLDTAITLFGINQLFTMFSSSNIPPTTEPLLQKLHKRGTLFIKNIHFLDLESQNNLANFIRYGFYKILKSERKMFSDVRIICSTNQNLEQLTKQGLFSETLLRELHTTSLTLPTLLTLPKSEIETLIEHFAKQALIHENTNNIFLNISDQDREQVIAQHPASLYEIKEAIKAILLKKSKKTPLHTETTFDPAYNISDPKLTEAARLGKYALKDPSLMHMLWNKFKNQNKIAQFLGVNRSSVHRRCKDYGIIEEK